jgi:hypothetical protein
MNLTPSILRAYSPAVHVEQAEERLRAMFADAALDVERLDPAATWRVFKEFAREPVEGLASDPEADLCLFEYGVYDWSDGKGPRFNWSFCRQFSFEDDEGEYDHMEQVRCDLFFEPTDATSSLTGEVWSESRSESSVAEWVAAVEASEGFLAVLGAPPSESRVEQNHV